MSTSRASCVRLKLAFVYHCPIKRLVGEEGHQRFTVTARQREGRRLAMSFTAQRNKIFVQRQTVKA